MHKFLMALALVASPAYAEDDVIARVTADLEATRAANRANEAKVLADNQALINQLNADIAKYEKQYGPIRNHRIYNSRPLVYRGRYIGNSLVCIQGHCY